MDAILESRVEACVETGLLVVQGEAGHLQCWPLPSRYAVVRVCRKAH
ncbi:MAG: hypothetical protein ACOYM3_24920 [Terrimicrobiaceae bacterium]